MAEQDDTPQVLEEVAPTRDRETGALIEPPSETSQVPVVPDSTPAESTTESAAAETAVEEEPEAPVAGSAEPPAPQPEEVSSLDPTATSSEDTAPNQTDSKPVSSTDVSDTETSSVDTPTSSAAPTNWAPVHDALDIVDTYLNGLRTKVAELRAFAQQESSKS